MTSELRQTAPSRAPGYYPNKKWGNDMAYWDGEQWMEMAEADRPLTFGRQVQARFKYHPAKTTAALVMLGLQLTISAFVLLIAVLLIYYGLKAG